MRLWKGELVVLDGQPDGSFVDRTLDAGLKLRDREAPGLADTPWSVILIDLDQDGRQDVLTTTGDDVTDFRAIDGPLFRSAAWWNAGDGTFIEVTDELGFGVLGNWHGLLAHDADGDGDGDLFMGGGMPPRLFRNDLDTGNHGLSISLAGTTSNALGIGAHVEVEADAHRHSPRRAPRRGRPPHCPYDLRWAGCSGLRQHRVHWPSGTISEHHDVAAGQHVVLTEPPTLALSVPDRHIPADGTSFVELTVTPRLPDGTIAPASSVVVTPHGSAVSIAAPVGHHPDGSYSVIITAPTTPGSTVLEVSIDGTALQVRHRLWWDLLD